AAAARDADGLIKRPIPSGSGYLPAAIGKLTDNLYLLFCVETSLGRMDAPDAGAEHARTGSGEQPIEDTSSAPSPHSLLQPAQADPADTDIGEHDLPSVAAEDIGQSSADAQQAETLPDAEQATEMLLDAEQAIEIPLDEPVAE